MNRKNSIRSLFSIYSIRKRVFFLTKILIAVCLLVYFIASLFNGWFSDFVFVGLLLLLILGWDCILGKIVAQPIDEIGKAAQRMAELDFSQPCKVEVEGELQTLAENLNTTAANLKNALAQRKELTDTLSHELKTPLGIIMAYAEGLTDAGTDKQAEYSRVIIEETEKMAGMVNGLLELSALEAGATNLNKEQFDLVELVETVAGREYLDLPTVAFQLAYTLPDTSIHILADKTKLRQVLHNFMGNSKKFVPENGRIQFDVTANKGTVCFTIYNDGPKLEDEVWEKFHRDKSERNQNGSGLGLAISAQILAMHNAKYGLRNKENGIEFYFELPISE